LHSTDSCGVKGQETEFATGDRFSLEKVMVALCTSTMKRRGRRFYQIERMLVEAKALRLI